MNRNEATAQSPLRILDRVLNGGLGKGDLGVVMAPAGVGKTACLVQIALDNLLRNRQVLHFAVGQSVEHVSTWYDALFDDLTRIAEIPDRDEARATVKRNSVIKAFPSGGFAMARFDESIALFGKHMQFTPKAILIDGLDWAHPSISATVRDLKERATNLGAELWLTAQTARNVTLKSAGTPPPCDACAALITVGLFLEPRGSHVAVRLLKDGALVPESTAFMALHNDTMRLVAGGDSAISTRVPAANHTLLSGGANGSEALFGGCAEAWGLAEETFSFPSHTPAHTRGLVQLTEEELAAGDISSSYLKAHMHRSYPDTPLFKKVLQSIWHQVNTAGEVFSIGQIREDKTVNGGTGWAVELAKHWNKPVHVFDQEKNAWFYWQNGEWVLTKDPIITRERFTGTGTRFPNAAGTAAIKALFERSFGPAPK